MEKGLLTVSTPQRSYTWLDNFLKFAKDSGYPIHIVFNNCSERREPELRDKYKSYSLWFNRHDGFEIGGIEREFVDGSFDEFVFLQDTFEILNPTIFDHVFNQHDGKSVAFCHNTWASYLVKYRREVLAKMCFPKLSQKTESIYFERHFNNVYWELEALDRRVRLEHPYQWKSVSDKFENKFGRDNMVVGNEFLLKYNGTWSDATLTDELRSRYSKVPLIPGGEVVSQ